MATPSPATSLAPHLPFRYVGGDCSLDLVNTVTWTARGPVQDRIADYARLTEWAEGAGVHSPEHAARLRRSAAAHPREAAAAVEKARRARLVLARLFVELASGSLQARTIADYNTLLAEALTHLEIATVPPGGPRAAPPRRIAWRWRGAGDRLDAPLWPVVWSAASLVQSEEGGRIRACAAKDCGWVYVDRSRNGLRRWCEMGTCGTEAKTRRRAQRRRAEGEGAGPG